MSYGSNDTFDLVTGGGLLPHVSCKSVLLERNAQNQSLVDITLKLEIYEDVEKIANSQWLNDIHIPGSEFPSSLLDSLFLQVIPVPGTDAQYLKPSYKPDWPDVEGVTPAALSITSETPTSIHNQPWLGSIYNAFYWLGDGYLPRGSWDAQGVASSAKTGMYLGPQFEDHVLKNTSATTSEWYGDSPTGFQGFQTTPIKISDGSLVGDLGGAKLQQAISQGKIPEVTKNGKLYYAIPFEYKIVYNPAGFYGTGTTKVWVDGELQEWDGEPIDFGENHDLGFIFYTYLSLPHFVRESDLVIEDEFWESMIIEGPVNTEIVIVNGQPATTRETFIRNDTGEEWHGSVHHHGKDRAVPGLALQTSDYVGYMAGEIHRPGQDQPKLTVIENLNKKIVDFRSNADQSPADLKVGLFEFDDDGNVVWGTSTGHSGLDPNYDKINLLLKGDASTATTATYGVLSPFQKEVSKDLIPADFDGYPYSKLHVCRDRQNNARGWFFINFRNFIARNSLLYNFLGPNGQKAAEVFKNTKLLELKLYRDRVKKPAHTIGTGTQKFKKGEAFEESSELIATLSDENDWGTPTNKPDLFELKPGGPGFSSPQVRYFVFSDRSISAQDAGHYRYRIEIAVKDGTYSLLKRNLNKLIKHRIGLEKYYTLATTGGTIVDFRDASYNSALLSEDYKKSIFKPYYDSKTGGFTDAFNNQVDKIPARDACIFIGIFNELLTTGKILNETTEGLKAGEEFWQIISGPGASPKGIKFVLQIADTIINKISKALDLSKTKRSGNVLNNTSVASLDYFENSSCPSKDMLVDSYSWESPEEIFKASSNENVYVDYLSIGLPLETSFDGLRSLNPEYYSDRCQLDAAKVYFHNKDFNSFNKGTNESYTAGSWAGYGSLTPSIIEISSPSSKKATVTSAIGARRGTYSFYHSVFYPKARSTLNTQTSASDEDQLMLSDDFHDFLNYEKLLAALSVYNLRIDAGDHADLSIAGLNVNELVGAGAPAHLKNQVAAIVEDVEARDAYKRLFENSNLTVHKASLHDFFFQKDPGAQPVIEPGITDTKQANWPNDYSDSFMPTHKYFREILDYAQASSYSGVIKDIKFPDVPVRLLENEHLGQSVPKGQDLGYPLSLRAGYGVGAFSGESENAWNSAIAQDSAGTTAFRFFNANMTAKIEMFGGHSALNKEPRNSEKFWKMISVNDIQNLDEDQVLICRIKPWSEKFIKGAVIPIVDRYFLIYKNANPGVPPYVPGPLWDIGGSSGFLDDQGVDEAVSTTPAGDSGAEANTEPQQSSEEGGAYE
tara:strand:+ start:3725 stop:7597 length:3873 start_codon:yes stop_codon:yes gene_type:complete